MNGVNRGLRHRALLLLIWLSGCAPLIGPYSPVAYQNATSLKAQTLALMDHATEPYDAHKQEVETLFVDAAKAHEFVRGVPSNSISSQQWAILIKKDGDLMGRFFSRWSERKTLTEPFISEFKPIIADAFDEIICLEANKKEATQCGAKGATK